MKYKFIELEIKNYIAEVTLARVESLNALSSGICLRDCRRFQKAGDDGRGKSDYPQKQSQNFLCRA